MFMGGGGFRGGRGGAAAMAFAGAQAAFGGGGGGRNDGFYMHDDRTDPEPEVSVGGARPAELSTAGTRMSVSNLGPEVTDEDLQELFEEHGGPLKSAEIFYKQGGESCGRGEVVFKRRADADKVSCSLSCTHIRKVAHLCALCARCADVVGLGNMALQPSEPSLT